MPKGKYSRPLNRTQKKIVKGMKPSGNTKNTLTAASARRRRDNDIYDKMPSLGKRNTAGQYPKKRKK